MDRDEFFSNLDLETSHLKPYEGFIFLCGGPTDVESPTPVSIRDAIYRELAKHDALEKRIRVAEHYKDWAHDSIYQDLLSFERHLAELSSVIVLVLESPGSIAELGLFSIVDEFQDKLLVFIETDHYRSSSFIKLGPVDYLEKIHKNIAQCHRWGKPDTFPPEFDPDSARALQAELAEAIQERITSPTPGHVFYPTSWLDTALLICDIISICSAVTIREIRSVLAATGLHKRESEVRQFLFILEKVELITQEPKGDQRFYISIDERQFVTMHFKKEGIDISRFRMDQMEKYRKCDRRRFRAIQEARLRHEDRK